MFDFHKLESDRINLNNLNLDSDTPVSKQASGVLMGAVVPTSQEFNLIKHIVVHLFMCLLLYALKIN